MERLDTARDPLDEGMAEVIAKGLSEAQKARLAEIKRLKSEAHNAHGTQRD